MTVLKGVAGFGILCLNSRESFEDSKRFLRSRMETEENPVVRRLLEKDQVSLDRIPLVKVTPKEPDATAFNCSAFTMPAFCLLRLASLTT